MAQAGLTAEIQELAGGSNWFMNLSSVVEDVTHADAGAVLRPSVSGSPGIEAIPTQHINAWNVARMLYGTKSETLRARKAGHLFVIDEDADMWGGGLATFPADQLTVPNSGLMARNLVFNQAEEDWYDGAPADDLDRVIPIEITAPSAGVPTGIKLDPANDRAVLALSTSAVATIRVVSGGSMTPEVALTASSGIVDLGALTALGSAKVTNGTLTVGGLSGSETLVGWLLFAPYQDID